jgi:hypothetical protein
MRVPNQEYCELSAHCCPLQGSMGRSRSSGAPAAWPWMILALRCALLCDLPLVVRGGEERWRYDRDFLHFSPEGRLYQVNGNGFVLVVMCLA